MKFLVLSFWKLKEHGHIGQDRHTYRDRWYPTHCTVAFIGDIVTKRAWNSYEQQMCYSRCQCTANRQAFSLFMKIYKDIVCKCRTNIFCASTLLRESSTCLLTRPSNFCTSYLQNAIRNRAYLLTTPPQYFPSSKPKPRNTAVRLILIWLISSHFILCLSALIVFCHTGTCMSVYIVYMPLWYWSLFSIVQSSQLAARVYVVYYSRV